MMAGPHALAHYVDRSRHIAAAVQRRLEGCPRAAAVVASDLEQAQAKIADLDAEAVALAATLKVLIRAGIERLRHARLEQDLHAMQRDIDVQNRRVAYEWRSAIAEANQLRLLADALAAELADARARAPV